MGSDATEAAEAPKPEYELTEQQEMALDVLLELLELQIEFNNKTNGVAWLDGTTKDDREIDWYRCMRQEASELIDCFPWKHWKDINSLVDMGNAKIEAVDILHFLLSQLATYAHVNKIDHREMITMALTSTVRPQDYRSDVELIEYFIFCTLEQDLAICCDLFFIICDRLDMSIAETRELYICKNALNTFRQINGYKGGSYIKMWTTIDGDVIEDNEALRNILKDDPCFTYDNLLLRLHDEYQLVLDR